MQVSPLHWAGVVTATSAQARFNGSPLAPGCRKHTVTTVVAPAGRPLIGIASSANLARPEPTQSVVATVPTLAKVWPPSTETRTAAAAVEPEVVAVAAMSALHTFPEQTGVSLVATMLSAVPPASAGAAQARHNANAATACPQRCLGISISLFPLVKFKNEPVGRVAAGDRRP